MKWILMLMLTLTGFSCAAPPVYQRQAVFDEAQYAGYEGEGTASIRGQAFLKTAGGDVKYAAGNEVLLAPVTDYSTEWFNVHVMREEAISPSDPRAEKYYRSAMADGEGRFQFNNLPAGDYYIASSVYWQYVAGTGYGASAATTGGMVGKRVTVAPGEQLEVVITR